MLQIIIILLAAEIVIPLINLTITPPVLRFVQIGVYLITTVWVIYSLYHGKVGF